MCRGEFSQTNSFLQRQSRRLLKLIVHRHVSSGVLEVFRLREPYVAVHIRDARPLIGNRSEITAKPFDDGEHILYINGQYNGDDDLGRLMHDFRFSEPDDMLIAELASRTRYFIHNPERVKYMCKARASTGICS